MDELIEHEALVGQEWIEGADGRPVVEWTAECECGWRRVFSTPEMASEAAEEHDRGE